MATTLVASTMTMNSKIAVHAHPAWRDKANFMIFADLSESGLSGRWEQLWSRQLSETEFQLCCIPFFTYGLALGDRVTTGPAKDKKYVIQSVTRKSGRLVYRIWFDKVKNKNRIREKIVQYIESRNWEFEWSSENLLAVSISSSQEETDFMVFVDGYKGQGIIFESGA